MKSESIVDWEHFNVGCFLGIFLGLFGYAFLGPWYPNSDWVTLVGLISGFAIAGWTVAYGAHLNAQAARDRDDRILRDEQVALIATILPEIDLIYEVACKQYDHFSSASRPGSFMYVQGDIVPSFYVWSAVSGRVGILGVNNATQIGSVYHQAEKVVLSLRGAKNHATKEVLEELQLLSVVAKTAKDVLAGEPPRIP